MASATTITTAAAFRRSSAFTAPLPLPCVGARASTVHAVPVSSPVVVARARRSPVRFAPTATAAAASTYSSSSSSSQSPSAAGTGSRRHHHQQQHRHHHQQQGVRAPVVNSRVASAVEAHHWITVSSESVRLFERAAVAHADMVRRVERHAQNGSLHRWVLRAVEDPALVAPLQTANAQCRYVVMETFKPAQDPAGPPDGIMRRWLGAIERLGPALNAPVAQTLQYNNVFTSKLHDAKFDVDSAVVIVESVNAARPSAVADLQKVLESNAEASVACGDCLEFCVLEALDAPGFFKTIEVYANIDLLRKHVGGLDSVFLENAAPFIARSSHRSRSAFRPVVFS